MSGRTVAYIMPLPPGLHPGMDAIAHGTALGWLIDPYEKCVFGSDSQLALNQIFISSLRF